MMLLQDPLEDSVVNMRGHVFCYQCVSEYLTGDDNTCLASDCKEQLGSDVVFSEATLRRESLTTLMLVHQIPHLMIHQ
jgi:DNA repair protein RAD16